MQQIQPKQKHRHCYVVSIWQHVMGLQLLLFPVDCADLPGIKAQELSNAVFKEKSNFMPMAYATEEFKSSLRWLKSGSEMLLLSISTYSACSQCSFRKTNAYNDISSVDKYVVTVRMLPWDLKIQIQVSAEP